MESNLGWTPEGWEDYREWYPNTPQLPESSSAGACRFANIWKRLETHNHAARYELPGSKEDLFVLVRGLFGNLMPGNFVPVLRHFRAMGRSAIRPRSYMAATVARSAERLGAQLRPRLQHVRRLVWLSQSRGGLDTLWALSQYPELRERTAGVVLVQTPSAASAIMQSVLTGCHAETITSWRTRAAEKLQRAIFRWPAFRDGCAELLSPAIDRQVATLRDYDFPFPILAVATWSIEPTSWVDSYHRRLAEIRPGCAHDGQFYLQDQLWPNAEQIVLGRIDHAQSVVGGKGFDVARFWMALTAMLLERADEVDVTRSPTLRRQSSTAS